MSSIGTGRAQRGKKDVRQTTVVSHVEKLDEFIFGLL